MFVDYGDSENVRTSRPKSARDLTERGRWVRDVFHHILRNVQVNGLIGERQCFQVFAAHAVNKTPNGRIRVELRRDVIFAPFREFDTCSTTAWRTFVDQKILPVWVVRLNYGHQGAFPRDASTIHAFEMVPQPFVL